MHMCIYKYIVVCIFIHIQIHTYVRTNMYATYTNMCTRVYIDRERGRDETDMKTEMKVEMERETERAREREMEIEIELYTYIYIYVYMYVCTDGCMYIHVSLNRREYAQPPAHAVH